MLLFCCHSQAVSIAIYSLKSNLTVMSLVVINFSFTTVFMSSSVYDCMLKKALLPRNLHCFQIIIQRFISIISQRHHTLAYVPVGTKRPKPTFALDSFAHLLSIEHVLFRCDRVHPSTQFSIPEGYLKVPSILSSPHPHFASFEPSSRAKIRGHLRPSPRLPRAAR
jgi:hypothetical protein